MAHKIRIGPALQYVRGGGWRAANVDPEDVPLARSIGTRLIDGRKYALFMVERTMVAQLLEDDAGAPRAVGRRRAGVKPKVRRGKRKPKLSRVLCPHHGTDVGCMLCDDRGLIPAKDLPRRRPSRVHRLRRVGGADPTFWIVELAARKQTVGSRGGDHVWIGRVPRNDKGVKPGLYVFVAEGALVMSHYGPYRTIAQARAGVAATGFVGADDPRLLPPRERTYTVKGRKFHKGGAHTAGR